MPGLENSARRIYEVGVFVFDRVKSVLLFQGNVVGLSGRPMEVFSELFNQRTDSFVEGTKLLKKIWGGGNAGTEESNLTHAVTAIRKTLRKYDSTQEYVDTIPGGYKLIASVKEIRDVWSEYAERIQQFYEQPPTPAYLYGKVEAGVDWRRRDSGSQDPTLLDMLTRSFIAPRRPRILLLGEYGTGKTKLCGALAYELAKQFVAHGNDPKIPILVPLRYVEDTANLNHFILDILQNVYSCNVTEEEFLKARNDGKLWLYPRRLRRISGHSRSRRRTILPGPFSSIVSELGTAHLRTV